MNMTQPLLADAFAAAARGQVEAWPDLHVLCPTSSQNASAP